MGKWNLPLLLIAVYVAGTLCGRAQDQLERVAQEELDWINTAFGLSSKLNFTDSDEILADPKGTIFFPEAVVKSIEQNTNVTEGREVIRFMLAHEQTHELQFKEYGVEAVRPSNGQPNRLRQISRIRESQADILGATDTNR